MANFKVHLSGGVVVGLAVSAAAIGLGVLSGYFKPAMLVLLPVAIGGVAPDIDSDSSVTFHVVFGIMSSVVGVLAALVAHAARPGEPLVMIASAAIAAAFVRFGVGHVFKKMTCHRGMAHSLPAVVLASLLAFLAGESLGMSGTDSLVFGLSFGVGYLLHLVLDEVYATVDFEGRHLSVKKSFGSALKLYSSRRKITALVYSMTALTAFFAADRLLPAIESLRSVI